MTGAYDFKRWTGNWWETPRGHWATTKTATTDWKARSAFLTCPLCGEVAGLPHAVTADGRVTPSVVCPNGPKCPMHLSPVRLLEWDLGVKPADR
jgi:hypothetical protein